MQQLAYNVFLLTETDVTESILRQALEDLIDQNSAIFIEQVQPLTTYQLNFLRAVLAGNHNGFGEKEIRENYDLGVPSNIVRLKRSLIDKELIEITKDGVIIGDPVLRLWLKKVL